MTTVLQPGTRVTVNEDYGQIILTGTVECSPAENQPYYIVKLDGGFFGRNRTVYITRLVVHPDSIIVVNPKG